MNEIDISKLKRSRTWPSIKPNVSLVKSHSSRARQAASGGRQQSRSHKKVQAFVVADISEEGVQQTARLIEELGSRALAVACDVRKADEVKAAVDQAVTAFGRIDVAFNNAGIEQPYGAIADVA